MHKRNIPGFPGYSVTEDNRVFSHRKPTLKELTPRVNGQGRVQVGLYKDGKLYHVQLSRLVALAWIPNPNNYPCVLHKDDNPLNNHVSNLEWGTFRKNTQDCIKRGRRNNSKYTLEQIKKVVYMRRVGHEYPEIAEATGIPHKYCVVLCSRNNKVNNGPHSQDI